MRLKQSVMQIVTCLMLLFHLATGHAEQDMAQFEKEFSQAYQLERAGKSAQAIVAYDKLIARYPDQPEPYNNLAALLAAQGKLDLARERLEKAIHINDTYATIYDNLSAVYVEMARGSYAKALQLGVTQRELALKGVDAKAVQEVKSGQNIVVANNRSIQPGSDKRNIQSIDPAKQLDEIKMTLQGWASAWSAQEVDLYLSFYAPAFKPASAQSRRSWEQLRSERLRKPAWVKVTVDDIQIEESEAGQAKVRFIQEYLSDNYKDITHKEVLMQSSTDGWQILAESVL